MRADEIYQVLKDRFGEKILEFQGEVIDPFIKVTPDGLLDVAECVRHEPDLYFDALMSLSGIDYGEKLGVVYHLHSMKHLHKVTVKVEVTRDHPRLPTLCFIWKTAEWHEREVYDLFGITFENHPDMRRILLPDDWIGHPLRRDYVTPEFYVSKEFPEGIRVPYPDKDPDRGTYIPPSP